MTIPTPPDHLTAEQAAVWFDILQSLEDGWITKESNDLLAAYCQHVCQQRRLGHLIAVHEAALELHNANAAEVFDPTEFDGPQDAPAFEMNEWVKTYDKLLKMLDRENRAMSSLATRLRITNQSLRSNKSDKPARKSKPWDSKPQPDAS